MPGIKKGVNSDGCLVNGQKEWSGFKSAGEISKNEKQKQKQEVREEMRKVNMRQ